VVGGWEGEVEGGWEWWIFLLRGEGLVYLAILVGYGCGSLVHLGLFFSLDTHWFSSYLSPEKRRGQGGRGKGVTA